MNSINPAYDACERWQPGGEWGRPIRLLSRYVETDAAAGPLAPLTLKAEFFFTPNGADWEHHSGATLRVYFDAAHSFPHRYGPYRCVGLFESGSAADEFDFVEETPLPPHERYWQEVRVSGAALSCFPGDDMQQVRDRMLQPGICVEAITAMRAGGSSQPGWTMGGRILALHFAAADPLPRVRSPF